MRLNLIAVGKRMPIWVDTAFIEYSKRLPKNINFNLTEIIPANRNKNRNSDESKKIEEEKINAVISSDDLVIALDVKGKLISSLSLSKKLNTWIDNQQQISILIGGADEVSS